MSDYFPWDILIEIFSWLPVKSLLRFKCVSKSFYYLISRDATFKKKHLHQSKLARAIVYSAKEPSCVISCHPVSLASDDKPIDEDMIKVDLPIEVEGHNFWSRSIYNCCDGMFCMRDDITGVSIWNPHTRELMRIPDCRPPFDIKSVFRVKTVRYGLAYDSVSDVYKVLAVVVLYHMQNRQFELEFKIYSLKMDSTWRKIKDVFPNKHLMNLSNMTLANGAFHWIGSDVLDSSYWLVALDMVEEKFRRFALPEWLGNSRQIPTLCILREKLCFFTRDRNFNHLWMMEEYGVLQSVVQILSICRTNSIFVSDSCKPLYLFEDGTIMIYTYTPVKENVVIYKDGRIVYTSASIADCDSVCAYIGMETLISPHMSN